MKKFYTFLYLLLFPGFTCLTPVFGSMPDNGMSKKDSLIYGGYVSGQWTPEYNYIIKGDIEIFGYPGIPDTLEILPGVSVFFDGDVTFTVHGMLIANGQKNALVSFTMYGSLPWYGFRFKSCPSPELEYCLFQGTKENALFNEYGAIRFEEVSPVNPINNCTFADNSGGGIYISEFNTVQTIEIKNNVFDNERQFGVKIINGNITGSLILSGNSFDCSATSGDNFGLYMKFCDCALLDSHSNHYSGFYTDTDTQTGSAMTVITNNPLDVQMDHDTIISNKGIGVGGIWIGQCDHFMASQCYFDQNQGQQRAALLANCNDVILQGNTFSDNKNLSGYFGGGAVMLSVPVTTGGSNDIVVNNNIFSGNLCSGSLFYGGALHIKSSQTINSITFTGQNQFISNEVQGKGGAIYIECPTVETVILQNIVLSDSTKAREGGFLYLTCDTLGRLTVNSTNGDGQEVLCRATNGDGGFATIIGSSYIDGIIIQSNHLSASVAKANGGYLAITGSRIGMMNISNNVLDSCTAGASGGFVALQAGDMDSLTMNQNKADIKSIAGMDGGFLFAQGGYFNVIDIERNNVTTAMAETNGGFAYFNADSTGDFSFKSNVMSVNKVKNGEGGCLYLNGGAFGQVTMTNNEISGQATALHGAAGYFKATDFIGELNYSNNKLGDNTAVLSGGVLFLTTAVCGPVTVQNNSATGHAEALAGDGGFLYLQADSCTSLDFIDNNVSDSAYAHGSGGMVLLASMAKVNAVTCDGNTAGHAVVTEGSGGFMSLAVPALDVLSFSGNQVTGGSSSGLDGGSLYLDVDGDVGSVTLQNNNSGNCNAAGGNGGFASLNIGGSMAAMTAMTNTVAAAAAHHSGGAFYVDIGHLIGEAEFNGNTVSSGSTASGGHGGMVMIHADSCQMVSFFDNAVSGTAMASLDGGMIYLATNRRIDTLDITGNTCHDAKSNGGDGGMVYIALPSLGRLNFEQNTVGGAATASGNGGFLSLDIAGTIGEVNVVDNQSGSSTATGGNGGFINIQSDSCDTFIFTGNKVSSLSKAAQNGGLLFLETNKAVNALVLSGNTAGSVQATADNGGWGCFTVPSIGYIDFSQNTVTGAASAGINGGCLYLNIPERVDSILVRSNHTGSCQALTGDGGVIYLKTENKPDVLEISDNTVKNGNAVEGSGGMAYISLPSAGYLKFLDNTVTDSTRAQLNGGWLYLDLAGDADSLLLSSNVTGKSVAATGNGGYAAIQVTGSVGRLELASNSCNDARAGASGGYLHLEAASAGVISCHHETIQGLTAAQAGNGGYLDIVTSGDLVSLDYEMNDIANSYAGVNGGMVSVIAGHAGDLSFHGNDDNNNPFGNATAGNNGGALYIDCQNDMTRLTMVQNAFSNTTCGNDGGAVYIHNGSNTGVSSVMLTNNTFNDQAISLTTKRGGGVYADNIHRVLISNCTFMNLAADSLGGALAIVNADSVTLSNGNTFIYNTAGFSSGAPAVNEAAGGAAYFGNAGYLMISGNTFTGNATTLLGGGLYCETITEATLTRNTFLNNKITAGDPTLISKGGAFYAGAIEMISTSHNIITGNFAKHGGGSYLDNSGVLIDSNTFTNNGGITDIVTIDGGGCYLNDSHGTAMQNAVLSNTVQNAGGGFYIKQSGAPGQETLTLSDNFIFNNRARQGGGVFCNNMPVLFIRDHISDNACINSIYSSVNNGAGVYLTGEAAASVFYNCIIYKNIIASDVNRGSGIYVDPAGTGGSDSTHIINCTLYENNFYGLYLKEYAGQTNPCEVLNTIMYSNNTLLDGSGTFDEQQANFENPDILTDYSLICPVPGSAHGDSVFCASPGFKDRSVFLMPASACVNHGDPSAEYNDVFFPPSYLPERNDIGVTGGPYAFTDTSALYLSPLPVITALFNVVDEACLTVTFKPKIYMTEATYIWIVDGSYYTDGYDPLTGSFVFDFQTTGTHQVCLYAEESYQNTVISDQTCQEVYIPSYPPVATQPYICDHSQHVTVKNDTVHIKQSHFAYAPALEICASYTVPQADEEYYYATWDSLSSEAVHIDSSTSTTLDLTVLPGINAFPELPVTYRVKSTVGCPGTTAVYKLKVVIVNDVGIDEPEACPLQVILSPNPASEQSKLIMMGGFKGTFSLNIYSIDNKCLLQKTLTKSEFILQESIDLKNFSPGIYIGLIQSDGGEKRFKLIKY
jgi:hypothetical protein